MSATTIEDNGTTARDSEAFPAPVVELVRQR
jgi:hypothetical protein